MSPVLEYPDELNPFDMSGQVQTSPVQAYPSPCLSTESPSLDLSRASPNLSRTSSNLSVNISDPGGPSPSQTSINQSEKVYPDDLNPFGDDVTAVTDVVTVVTDDVTTTIEEYPEVNNPFAEEQQDEPTPLRSSGTNCQSLTSLPVCHQPGLSPMTSTAIVRRKSRKKTRAPLPPGFKQRSTSLMIP
jgi:hypothetical protein